MSNLRATKSGFAREAQAKMDSKYDPAVSANILNWINRLTGLGVDENGDRAVFHATLKDGVVLCKLANALLPGSVPGKISPGKMTFTAGENYTKFLTAISKDPLRVATTEQFQAVDLWEAGNLAAVQICLQAVGRKAYSLGEDRGFGPRESHGEKREFTQAQLAAGKSVIGLQMGSNQGATQAGQSFGKGREIGGEYRK